MKKKSNIFTRLGNRLKSAYRSVVNKITRTPKYRKTKAVINTKTIDKYINTFESLTERTILKDIVRAYTKEGKVLTEARALYELKKEKIYSALDNTGYSFQEIADQVGINVNDLINPENWNESIYTDPNTGKRYQYEWKYEGTILNEIN